MSNFKEKMRILGTPYKKSEAYEVYGDTQHENFEASKFWKTGIGYIEKYEHAKFQSEKKQ